MVLQFIIPYIGTHVEEAEKVRRAKTEERMGGRKGGGGRGGGELLATAIAVALVAMIIGIIGMCGMRFTRFGFSIR